MSLTLTDLKDIIEFGLSQIGGIEGAKTLLQNFIGEEGQKAAAAVVLKVYKQDAATYAGDPGRVWDDGKTTAEHLAQKGFEEFRHYLRDGNGIYPGAPEIPALGAGADAVYDFGDLRTTIHNWCNKSAADLLANPPATA